MDLLALILAPAQVTAFITAIISSLVAGIFDLIGSNGVKTLLHNDLKTYSDLNKCKVDVKEEDVRRLEERIRYRLHISTHAFNWLNCTAIGCAIVLALSAWLLVGSNYGTTYSIDDNLIASLTPAMRETVTTTGNEAAEIRELINSQRGAKRMTTSYQTGLGPLELTSYSFRQIAPAICFVVIIVTIALSSISIIKAKRQASVAY